MQALPHNPTSLSLCEINDQLHLHIGLENGVLLRTVIDTITGNLSDSRSKFLGLKAIKLCKLKIKNQNAVLALSSKPHLCYGHLNHYQLAPISYEELDDAHGFSSSQCFQGLVGIKGSELRIVMINRLGEMFTQKIIETKYTPTKLYVNPSTNHLVLIEREYNCLTETQREILKQRIYDECKDEAYQSLNYQKVGYPKPSGESFASCLRIVDPGALNTVYLQEFENKETVFSIHMSNRIGVPGQVYLFLGIGEETNL